MQEERPPKKPTSPAQPYLDDGVNQQVKQHAQPTKQPQPYAQLNLISFDLQYHKIS